MSLLATAHDTSNACLAYHEVSKRRKMQRMASQRRCGERLPDCNARSLLGWRDMLWILVVHGRESFKMSAICRQFPVANMLALGAIVLAWNLLPQASYSADPPTLAELTARQPRPSWSRPTSKAA